MATKRETESDFSMKELIDVLTKVLNQKKRQESGTRDEFRYNINTKHYNYIYEAHERENKYYALGLTSEDTTFGKNNMPLKHNPQQGKTKNSYIRNGEIVAGRKSFSRKIEKNFKFDAEDAPNVKAKKRNAKKNIKQEQKKRKGEKKA